MKDSCASGPMGEKNDAMLGWQRQRLQADRREEEFLLWLAARGEGVRRADALRVTRELVQLAGAWADAEHVDRLLDAYRRRFEGANRIMLARTVAELFCIWQAECGLGRAGRVGGYGGVETHCRVSWPSAPNAPDPYAARANVTPPPEEKRRDDPCGIGTEADIPISEPPVPTQSPYVADNDWFVAQRADLPAVLGGPPAFRPALVGARAATIRPPGFGSDAPKVDTGSLPAGVMLPPLAQRPSKYSRRLAGLIAALITIVILFAVVIDGGTCGGAKVVTAAAGLQRSEHLGLQYAFAQPWSHAQDLDREETDGDWERRTSVYFRGSDPVQYESKLTIIVLSRRDGTPATEEDTRSAGANETLSLTVRDRSCRPVAERIGHRCQALNFVGPKPYDAVEHFFLLNGRVVYVRGLFRIRGEQPGSWQLTPGASESGSQETDLVVASLAPLSSP